MPEIPDIEVFCRNLKSAYGGKKLSYTKVVVGKKMKVTQKELTNAIEGLILEDVYRSGKEMRFLFSNGAVLGLHLMLTGDLFPFEEKNTRSKNITIVEFYFDDGSGLALLDRMKNAHVKLDLDEKKGIDALDKKLNFAYLKKALNRKTNIKNVLLDQNVIRGIGNSYSDEILWQTGISPFSRANAIPDDKIKELASNIKKVLKAAINKIYTNHPDLIHGEVKDYMNVHTKKKDKSPTGAEIKIEKKGIMKTYYTDEQIMYQ